ncbi:glycosyl transferase [Lipomyces japonicus]|uniref:glycosyl transferase n=1 Tax=Lipomyces japonicus TaxID=56871 RepID=UPI0034CDDDCE
MGFFLNRSLSLAFRDAVVASVCFKVLLFPAYKSTDFEVHRNWLSITYSLPLKEWYIEQTSPWTLDYPPFFAYFEWFLSQFARFVDPKMLIITNLNYSSTATIFFQRVSVIASELVLVYALQRYIKLLPEDKRKPAYAIAMSIYFSPGLLLIDNIHFQYNAMMYGILIFSIVSMSEKKYLLSGILFAVLLCFKHIYLYLAPAYFFYLLRVYCLDINRFSLANPFAVIQWEHIIRLGLSVILVGLLAFGPFIYLGQIPQLISRLFPFSRGLCHAYWAPNFWALYSGADRMLYFLSKKLLHHNFETDSAALTRGLVGDSSFVILPDVQPRATFLLTLFYQLISMAPLLLRPSFDNFISALSLCGYASFLFGWHVHEKAILLVIIPFSFLALKDRRYLTPFFLLTVSGYISIFPLIFTSSEAAIKYIYTFTWIFAFFNVFGDVAKVRHVRRIFLFDRIAYIYFLGFVPLLLFVSIYEKIPILKDLTFLKLMLISTYCAIGVVASWCGFSWLYLFAEND